MLDYTQVKEGPGMFIAKKHLSRRTVPRGMGAIVGLLMDAMVPAQTPLRKTAASPRSRLAYIEMVHGAAGSTEEGGQQHHWSPEKDGADHFRSSAVFLTAAHARQTFGTDVLNGTSIDQLYAQHFGMETRLPSAQLCIENVGLSGSCGFEYKLYLFGDHQLGLFNGSAADDGQSARGF